MFYAVFFAEDKLNTAYIENYTSALNPQLQKVSRHWPWLTRHVSIINTLINNEKKGLNERLTESMKIKNKLKLGISIAFLLILILSWFVIDKIADMQRQQLLEARFEQLVSLRESLASHIKDYQTTTILAIETIAHDRTVQQALTTFSTTYSQLGNGNNTDSKALLNHYQQNYINRINDQIPNAAKTRAVDAYLPRSTAGLLLQNHYILKQNNIVNHPYLTTHQQYHTYLFPLLKLHNFYDLFLVDTHGNIVYSAVKETDLGTNLLTGPYQNSGLAQAFKKSRQLESGVYAHAPFSPYEPSYNLPATFIAMPIHQNGKYIGSLAVQLPIEPINNIMTFNGQVAQSGLGDSGEVYIVGADATMRNDSRFLKDMENPLVQQLGTSIGIQKVETEATTQANNGKSGYGVIEDYRGIAVLSAYAPIELFGEQATITAEIDYRTVVKRIDAAINDLITKIAISLAALLGIILTFFNRLFLRPLKKINDNLERELLEQEKHVIVSRSLLNEYKKAVDASAIVSKTDKNGNITYTNIAFNEKTGYSRHEIIGKNHSIIKSDKTDAETHAELWRTISQKKIWKGILCNISKDKKEYYLSTTIVPILTLDSEIYEFISIGTDVTELYLRQEEIRLNTIDNLTQLPNRQSFLHNLSRNKNSFVAIINIDHFSEINDYYGYEIGDILLVKISKLLQGNVQEGVSVFRLAGDEFAILANQNYNAEHFEQECIELAEMIEKSPFQIKESELNISTTMGVAGGARNVYVNAGMALRVAKESQKKYLFYNSDVDLQKRTAENLHWSKAIKSAIEEDRIDLFLQPIVNRITGHTDKYECLMRIIDEEKKPVSPFFFINIAKYARLYPKLSEMIIKKSFKYFANKNVSFSINLTIIDILDERIIKLLREHMQNTSVAERVVLEIVESEGIDNFKQVSEFIQDMKSLGCKIAIDDFGTGYSNFEYLMKLDPDFIKIDGSIIKNIAHDHGVFTITKLIHDFAKSIGAITIAEYVCDIEVAEKLNEIGVDYYQGYHYGEPVPASTLILPSNKRKSAQLNSAA